MIKKRFTKEDAEKALEAYANSIAKFLQLNELSGFVYIPQYGVLTIFKDEIGRMRVLERAEVELAMDDFAIKDEALKNLQSQKYSKPRVVPNTPKYIG